ncbi:MAG: CPBP family intramembrane metalloprotease [Pseudomonadota bacterium]|nr:CPBP family intramembrane metalloprotease [Pseudomonadota bacterium]
MTSTAAMAAPSHTRAARFFRHPLVRIVLAAFAIALAAGLAFSLAESAPKSARIAWPHLLAAGAIVLTYWAYVRLFEARPMSEFGLRDAPRELAAGVAIGAAAVVTVLALLYAAGVYRPVGLNPWSAAIVIPLAEMVFVGVFEEVLCRAIIFRIVEQSLGSRAALAISALLFGLAHLPGNGLGPLAFVVAMVAGLVFSAAYMLTHRLWLCIGMHAAWNYTVGSIFSIAVSGHPAKGWVIGTLTGPQWLTGGAYGVEGSAATLLVFGAIGVAMLWRAARNGKLVAYPS